MPLPKLRTRTWIALGIAAFLSIVVMLQVLGGEDGLGLVTAGAGDWAYLSVFVLVTLDGICAIFPGETTLNTASTLAAQGVLSLWPVIVAGAAGAICGDSGMYWIARKGSVRYEQKLSRWLNHPRVAAALDFVGKDAAVVLIAARYLPGMRTIVTAMFGVQAYPYKRFLLWSSIGGATWSVFTCSLAYVIGVALVNFPLASVIISSLFTSVVIAVIYFSMRRTRRQRAETSTQPTA